MKASSIEELAYQIKQAREENLPKPIVFLGAGASKTGGIPLAGEIIKDIQARYGNNPKVKMLKPEEHTYPKLMECLTPNERNKLLKSYIDRAKINVTHIYLAQLLNKGFIDYVLTVNFDNLMLRAMALYNDFPPTYDMAILKDLTTTNFKEKSVLYLHGQHHGLWLLNTEEEMNKVSGIIPPILNKIANERPWIFIGYSGEDPIFDHIVRLGRFDNGLYWITYYDNKPSDDVCRNLLEKENTNAYLIKGYDADSFMLKLNQELGLHQPQILDKPFTSLKTSIENFVDIDDKDHFKGVKERLEIVKREVQRAIDQFEEGKIETAEVLKKEADISLLKKQIIDEILKGEYNDNFIHRLDAEVNQTDSTELSNLMAELYLGWGNKYYNNNRDGVDTVPFELSIEKYRRSAEWNPGYDLAYCNWGLALSAIGRIHKTDSSFYKQAIEKFSKAIELVSDNNFAYSNWGRSLFSIAKIEQDEAIYRESFEKFQKAVELKATDDYSYSLWGEALSNLAKLKTDETLYRECFEKFQKAAELNPGDPFTYSNWAIAVHNLAKQIDDEALYNQSFELYQKVMDLTPSDFITMSNYALAIHDLALLKKDPELYRQSFEKYAKAIELNAEDSLTYLNWGVACHDLANLQENESLYLESIQKYQKAAEIVKDWDLAYSNWGLALDQLAKLTKNESYYLQSIAQHQQAYDLNPGNLFYSKKLGAALLEFGKFKQNRELIERSVPFLKKAAENNGDAYDLACAYALLNDEENALPLLDTLLQQKAITVEYVEQDADWKSYSDNNQFKAILNRHRA